MDYWIESGTTLGHRAACYFLPRDKIYRSTDQEFTTYAMLTPRVHAHRALCVALVRRWPRLMDDRPMRFRGGEGEGATRGFQFGAPAVKLFPNMIGADPEGQKERGISMRHELLAPRVLSARPVSRPARSQPYVTSIPIRSEIPPSGIRFA